MQIDEAHFITNQYQDERGHTSNWWMLRWMCVRVLTSICGMYLDYLSEVIYLHRIISRLDHIINLSSTATCYFTLTYTQPSIRFGFFFLSQAHARTLKCTTLLIINVHPNLLICLKQFYLTFYFAHMMCILISYDFFWLFHLYGKMRKCTFCVKIKTGILHIFFWLVI